MPNDAKLGLLVGVGLTIAVAVVFFSKEPAAEARTPAKAKPTATTPAPGLERAAAGKQVSGEGVSGES